jgi:hypothetical protein
MSPRRKKSLKKKPLKKKPLKKKSKQNKTDQGKNINNKIKRQSKIIAVLEHYIKDINNLEKTINNYEKNKLVKKKTKSIKKIKKSKLRHNIPFDISMIKPNYQKTKRTMIEEEKKKNIKNQKPIFYGYDNTNIPSSSSFKN